MEKEYILFLTSTFLFDKIPYEKVSTILDPIRPELVKFKRGNIIFSPSEHEKKLAFIYDGECTVIKPDNSGSTITFNRLKKGGTFGITTIFSNNKMFPTTVRASTNCSVLFIDYGDLMSIIEKNSDVSINIMKFMTTRIEYLNQRVASFSSGSVEKKLAAYLLEQMKKYNSLQFHFNKKQSAEAIGCGRASLYRAAKSFETLELINIEKNEINIIDPIGLERKKQ